MNKDSDGLIIDLIKKNLENRVNVSNQLPDSLNELKELTDLAGKHVDNANKRADTDDKLSDIELKQLYAKRFLVFNLLQ